MRVDWLYSVSHIARSGKHSKEKSKPGFKLNYRSLFCISFISSRELNTNSIQFLDSGFPSEEIEKALQIDWQT